MNRDYHSRPIQGGSRDAHDYGHTHLDTYEPRPFWRYVFAAIVFLILVIVVGNIIEVVAP